MRSRPAKARSIATRLSTPPGTSSVTSSCPRVVGKDIEKPEEFAPMVAGIRGHNMAKGGLEAALWDLEARRQGKPLWKLLGGSREQIECGVSIGIQPTIDRLLR